MKDASQPNGGQRNWKKRRLQPQLAGRESPAQQCRELRREQSESCQESVSRLNCD
jgi:hypothetical protein